MKTVFSTVIIALCVIMLPLSCAKPDVGKTILPHGVKLSEGDILFRRGTGMLSHTVIAADGGRYSHVGIVVDSSGVMMVVHAVPGEPDFPGDPDRVKMEAVDKFYSSINASVGEVMRHNDAKAAALAAREALRLYRIGILFDHDYDARDTTKLYCSELIERAYMHSGVSLSEGRCHDFSVPGFSFKDVIMPSDIYRCSQLKSVCKF